MIIAPFMRRNVSFLDVCFHHKEGHVFMTRGIDYLDIHGIKVLKVYLDQESNLTALVPSYFKTFPPSGTTKGLVVSSNRNAEYIQISAKMNTMDKSTCRCTTLTTLKADISGTRLSDVLCLTSEKQFLDMVDALREDFIFHNLRSAMQQNSLVIVVKTSVEEDFKWIRDPVTIYDPKQTPL